MVSSLQSARPPQLHAVLDPPLGRLHLTELPGVSLTYQRSVRGVGFPVYNILERKISYVYVPEDELLRNEISPTVLKKVSNNPEELCDLIQDVPRFHAQLQLVPRNSEPERIRDFLFSKEEIRAINCAIQEGLLEHKNYLPKVEGKTPEIYIDYEKKGDTEIFIPLEREFLNEGTFGEVSMVYRFKYAEYAVQKVCKNPEKKLYKKSFERELNALRELNGKRGIIPLIAGGMYGETGNEKLVLFLPYCPMSLRDCLLEPTFPLSSENTKTIILQWLEGLTEIAKIKGVHADIKPSNLLLMLDIDGIHAVISDFGTFHYNHDPKFGVTSPAYASPECHVKLDTSKLDIWSFGVILQLILSNSTLPLWTLSEEETVPWILKLRFGWIDDYSEGIPPSVQAVLRDMLNPDYKNRPAARKVYTRLSQAFARHCGNSN
jgi:hypothetical protein